MQEIQLEDIIYYIDHKGDSTQWLDMYTTDLLIYSSFYPKHADFHQTLKGNPSYFSFQMNKNAGHHNRLEDAQVLMDMFIQNKKTYYPILQDMREKRIEEERRYQ